MNGVAGLDDAPACSCSIEGGQSVQHSRYTALRVEREHMPAALGRKKHLDRHPVEIQYNIEHISKLFRLCEAPRNSNFHVHLCARRVHYIIYSLVAICRSVAVAKS